MVDFNKNRFEVVLCLMLNPEQITEHHTPNMYIRFVVDFSPFYCAPNFESRGAREQPKHCSRRQFAARNRCITRGSLTLLLRQLTGLRLLQLGDARQTLGAEQTTAPVTTDLVLALVVVHLDGVHNLGEVGAIGRVDLRQSDGRAGLATDEQSEARLALDDAVWDAHFAAQRRQEENDLNKKKREKMD